MVKKGATSPFDIARVGFTDENGKFNSYTACSMCGKWHKGQYGIKIDFDMPDNTGGGRVKLCSKCAKKVKSQFDDFVENVFFTRCNKTDDSPRGQEIEKRIHNMFGL